MEKNNSITTHLNKNKWKKTFKSLSSKSFTLLITALLTLGIFTVNINNEAVTVYADDTTNTVPDNETTGNFYSGIVNTGFIPNGYTAPAVYGPSYGPYTVGGVYQSLSTSSPTSFAAGLPLGTIYIDQSMISQYGGVTEVVSKDTAIIAGLVNIDGTNRMGYDGTMPGAIKMVTGKINELNGDLFKVTFANAAVLPDGNRADLVITYSNAKIVIDQRYAAAPAGEQYYHGAVSLAQGNAFSYGGTDYTNMNATTYANDGVEIVDTTADKFHASYSKPSSGDANRFPVTGLTMDATYQIFNKDGTPAAGTFVFAVCGINLDRDPDVGGGNNAAKPLWYSFDDNFGGLNGKEHSFFSEAMQIIDGQVSNNVYVRPNNNLEDNPEKITGVKGSYFWANIANNTGSYSSTPATTQPTSVIPTTETCNNLSVYKDVNGVKYVLINNAYHKVNSVDGLKFISNAVNSPSLSGDDNSYNAGFVTLADAATGFKVTATGHGSSGRPMNSFVFNSKRIWYRYTSSTGGHGKIQTTSEGNFNGKLNDGGQILGPNKTFDINSMSPNDGRSTYVVAEGKSLTYTLTPDIGYKIGKLYIATAFNSEGVPTTYKEIKFKNDLISKMKKGDTIIVDTADASQWGGTTKAENGKGTLTYNEDGTYAFKFNYATEHEGIHVEWEKTTSDILVSKIWNDNNDKDGARVEADKNNKLPKFKLKVSKNLGKTWEDAVDVFGNPTTIENVPAGKVNGNYIDGIFEINHQNDPGVISKQNPFTWEYLPVYSYDSNGVAGNALMYKIVEVDDPWHREYEKAQYFEAETFVLTSEKTNAISGWLIYQDKNDNTKQYVHKGDVSEDGKYYVVNKNTGEVGAVADPQPNADDLDIITSDEYWTIDKAVPYYEGQVKNTHFATDIFVEVTKFWDDKELLNIDPPLPESDNAYRREDINIVLHGEMFYIDENDQEVIVGPVDFDPADPNNNDLIKTITTNESNKKEDVTGNVKIGTYTIYKNGSNVKYAYVENNENYEDGYYSLKNSDTEIDFENGPVVPAPSDVKPVKKGDGTYNLYDVDPTDPSKSTKYGAMFEDLPTHYNGYQIKYTVTETDTSGNELTKWIMTGGKLSEVKEGKNVIGYDTTIRNTPDVDDKYTELPLTIFKRDINTEHALEGAEFTIYTDYIGDKKADESSVKKIGANTIYSKIDEDGKVEKQYVIQKDSSDNKYKYYELNGTSIDSNPADPQPDKLDLTEDGILGGEDLVTDGNDNYVLRENIYYKVVNDAVTNPAVPQPDEKRIREVKEDNTGEVKNNVVTTDENGNAYITFYKTGTYEIKETKAPEGYEADPTIYRFKVDAELKKITLEEPDKEHTLNWWQRLWDLIFSNVTPSDSKWAPSEIEKGGTLTVDNTPIKADVLVRKYWKDNDNQDGKRPGDKDDPSSYDDEDLPTVTLRWTTSAHTADGYAVYQDTNSKKYIIKQDSTDNKYKYYEVESEDKTGVYETTAASPQPSIISVVDDETCQGNVIYIDDNDIKYVLIDHVYYVVNSIDIKGVISPDPVTDQPDPNTLNLVMDPGAIWQTYQYEEDGETKDATHRVNYVGGPVLTSQNNAYTWNDVPAYRDGKIVTYRILEQGDILNKNITDKYAYDIESNFTSMTHEPTFTLIKTVGTNISGLNQTVDVTNIHIPQIINIELEKIWDDDDESARKPTTLILYKIVNGVQSEVGRTTVHTDGSIDTPKWQDLPAYDGGYPITYMIEESTIEGYSVSYKVEYVKASDSTDVDNPINYFVAKDVKRTYYEEGDENTTAKFTIKNERTQNVTVYKTWINGANTNVTFQLWRTINPNPSEIDSTAVDPSTAAHYYVHKTTNEIITKDYYENLSPSEQDNYSIENTTSWSPYDGGGKEPSTYVKEDGSDPISKDRYNSLDDEQKALYYPKTVDGWELVGTHTFNANDFGNSNTGFKKQYSFNGLEIKDEKDNQYTYRVLEVESLLRFRENQINDTEIIDNNVNVSDGNEALEVVKELDGRKWLPNDKFYFYLEPVEGTDTDSEDPDHPVSITKEEVPMPYTIDPNTGEKTYYYTASQNDKKQVGAIGRAVTFNDIQFKETGSIYHNIERGHTAEFYYKVYEIYSPKSESDQIGQTIDEATNHTGKLNGITYAGDVVGDKFEPKVAEAKIIVKNNEGIITTEVQWKKEGQYVSGAVPVFTNTYSSEGYAKAWIEKKISNREWVDYDKNNNTGDAFGFEIDSISGAALNTPGSTGDSYQTKPLMSNLVDNPQSDIQKLSDTEYAFGVRGNRYDNTMLNSDGFAYFIYEIKELESVTYKDTEKGYDLDEYSVDGLQYDTNKIYAKLKAKDNWDGTISFTIEYFTDASCKDDYRIKNRTAWIYDDGTETENGKRLLSLKEIAEKDTWSPEEQAKCREINVAYFTNYESVDIPVVKEWVDGPAIEDVVLHLERHLFDINVENLDEDYVKEQEDDWKLNEEFWQTVGLTHTSKRGEFLKQDGTPNFDKQDYTRFNGYIYQGSPITQITYNELNTQQKESCAEANIYVNNNDSSIIITEEQFAALPNVESTTTSSKTYVNINGFNNNLPKYVLGEDGQMKRAVYRLYEDNTSDTYSTSYKTIKNGTVSEEEDYIFIDSGTLIVTNKVVATNTANIATVKQLLNRNWLESDSFKFVITPIGKAEYDNEGKITRILKTEDIPMPSSNEATTDIDEVVDPNGNLERLARFEEISYDINDLEYDPIDKHMQGDFYYEIKEEIPSSAIGYDKTNGKKTDITFNEDDRSKYIWIDSNGFTYDSLVHKVHVKVRENRTRNLQVQIAYDYKDYKDISSGTQFTPVFTNRYDAVTEFAVTINKYIMGRNWKDTDKFDFRMTALSGAPFEDADKDEFHPDDVEHDDPEYTDAQRNEYLDDKDTNPAVHSARGAHVKRLFVDPNNSIQTLTMPKIEFRLSELNKTVSKLGELKYPTSDHKEGTMPVPIGIAYGQFVYSLEETDDYLGKDFHTDLNIDKDTEYVRVTVIDMGNGTLDYYAEVFEDRYCQVPRLDPETQKPAQYPTFINQMKRSISITKAWADPASSDVTVRLQWSLDKNNWYDADEAIFLAGQPVTKTIAKYATGKDLTVTWSDLPAYANINSYVNQDPNDQNLDDKWIYYSIKEDTIPHIITRYSKEEYKEGESYNDEKYKELLPNLSNPFYTEAEGAPVIDKLYVTNWREELFGNAKFGVVKQYIGDVWDTEKFEFEVKPVKSKLGNANDYTTYEDQVIAHETDPTVKVMPTLNNNKAIAKNNSGIVSINEFAANFEALQIKLSDLGLDAKNNAIGEFIYEIREVIPDGVVKITEDGKTYYVMDDENHNKIKYTTDTHTVKIIAKDDGSGSIDITVSYDDRQTGEFVPVYTNYAMTPTPITGSKTWIGGNEDEHVHGTVTADGNTIINSSDKLGLKVYRKLENDGEDVDVEEIEKDEANRDLVIVWARLETVTEEGDFITYTFSTDGITADDPEIVVNAEDIDWNTYEVCVGDGSNRGCYIGVDRAQVEVPGTLVKYERANEDGIGYYTIMAKDENNIYYDPILNRVDKDGNRYIYYVTEEVPNGYEPDYDGLDITNTAQNVSLSFTKTWDDFDNKYGYRPSTKEYKSWIKLYQNDNPTSEYDDNLTVIDNGDTYTVTWNNLPKVDTSLVDYTYTAKETIPNDSYYVAIVSGKDNPILPGNPVDVGAHTRGGIRVDGAVTNKLIYRDITVRKIWVDDLRADNVGDGKTNIIKPVKPETITITLKSDKGDTYDVTDTLGANGQYDIGTYTDTTWTYIFKGLDIYDADGNKITYTLEEADTPNYVTTIDQDNFTITNTYIMTSITGKKVWVDGGLVHDNVKEVKLTLQRSLDNGQNWENVPESDYHIDWDKDGNYKFASLDKANNKEKEYIYRVYETVPAGYEVKYSGGDDVNYAYDKDTITNTIKQVKREITVEKIWVGENTEEVTITLVIDNDESEKQLIFNSDSANQQKFTDLDTYGEDGHLIIYTIKESKGSSNYHTSIAGNMDDGFVITNSFDETTLPVTKVWDDNNNQDNLRPENITVTLFIGEGETREEAFDLHGEKVEPITLTENNGWAGVFKDVPRTNNSGEVIEYTIEETVPEGYEASYQKSNKGFIIINKHIPETVQVSVSKEWLGDEGKESYRDDVVVHLYGLNSKGAVVYDAGAKTMKYDDYTETTSSVSWENIPKRHFESDPLQWDVVEEAFYGYTPSYEYNDDRTEWTIKNTYSGPVTNITVNKQWEDNEDIDNVRPDTVTYQLKMRVGNETDEQGEPVIHDVGEPVTVDVLEDGTATYTWENLEVVTNISNDTSTETTYTSETKTKEEPILNSEGKKQYYEIENGDNKITEDEYKTKTPEEQKAYKLLTETISYEETSRDDDFEVPVVEEVPILYTVEEIYTDALSNVEYEEPIVISEVPGQYIAINRRKQEMIPIKVKKIWNDTRDGVINKDGLRPDNLKVTLKQDGEEIATMLLTGENTEEMWSGTFGEFPVYKHNSSGTGGEAIVYTVEEEDVSQYSESEPAYDGEFYVFTNTLELTKPVTVKATKNWADDEDIKGQRPEVTFRLMKKVDYSEKEIGEACTIKPSQEEPQECVWESLDPLEDGKPIVYTVKEDHVERYIDTTVTNIEHTEDGDIINVEITNTFVEHDQATPLSYVDHKSPDGAMILKATKYENYDVAHEESKTQEGAPQVPEYDHYKFVGWDVNYNKNSGFILVAKYEKDDLLVTYVDPLSGSPIVKDEYTDDPSSVTDPSNPAHSGYIFTGWKEVLDSAGNHIRVATFKCNCASPGPGPNPCPVNPTGYTPPRTGIVYSLINFFKSIFD